MLKTAAVAVSLAFSANAAGAGAGDACSEIVRPTSDGGTTSADPLVVFPPAFVPVPLAAALPPVSVTAVAAVDPGVVAAALVLPFLLVEVERRRFAAGALAVGEAATADVSAAVDGDA